eukprot:GEMP01099255.1.p1 GENE.GEMP01099255.1~~GEMP01099255.1.p1  ORF type:complete len:112 (+),score=1.00 GEMP01099255.1:96-431(+)
MHVFISHPTNYKRNERPPPLPPPPLLPTPIQHKKECLDTANKKQYREIRTRSEIRNERDILVIVFYLPNLYIYIYAPCRRHQSGFSYREVFSRKFHFSHLTTIWWEMTLHK